MPGLPQAWDPLCWLATAPADGATARAIRGIHTRLWWDRGKAKICMNQCIGGPLLMMPTPSDQRHRTGNLNTRAENLPKSEESLVSSAAVTVPHARLQHVCTHAVKPR